MQCTDEFSTTFKRCDDIQIKSLIGNACAETTCEFRFHTDNLAVVWSDLTDRKGVTSLQKELGHEVPMEEVKERLCKELVNLLS